MDDLVLLPKMKLKKVISIFMFYGRRSVIWQKKKPLFLRSEGGLWTLDQLSKYLFLLQAFFRIDLLFRWVHITPIQDFVNSHLFPERISNSYHIYPQPNYPREEICDQVGLTNEGSIMINQF